MMVAKTWTDARYPDTTFWTFREGEIWVEKIKMGARHTGLMIVSSPEKELAMASAVAAMNEHAVRCKGCPDIGVARTAIMLQATEVE